MTQCPVRRGGNRQVVQLEFVPLLAVDVVQHLLQYLVVVEG